MADSGKCRSCNVAVLWVILASGRRMPLDATPCPGKGNVRLLPGGAEVLSGDALTEASDAQEELYLSHFATCPNANKHRKP